jgi:hypothetical protein
MVIKYYKELYTPYYGYTVMITGSILNKTRDLNLLTGSDHQMLLDWCDEYCDGCVEQGIDYYKFELESDVTLFKLTWL